MMITLFPSKDDMQRIKHIISIYLFFTVFSLFFVNIYTSYIFAFIFIFIYLYIYMYSVYTLYIKYICDVRSYALTRINNHLYVSFYSTRQHAIHMCSMAGSSKIRRNNGKERNRVRTSRSDSIAYFGMDSRYLLRFHIGSSGSVIPGDAKSFFRHSGVLSTVCVRKI